MTRGGRAGSRRPGRVRIIGGRWRRRQLPVVATPSLRPTSDRVRETLFNWLDPLIEGAVCLDLFAGSGALGFEAASRGAARVVMVERDPELARSLREQARILGATQVDIVVGDALLWLENPSERFDIVFLDPPFEFEMIDELCVRLEGGDWLKSGAAVYIEQRFGAGPPTLPERWQVTRERKAGRVRIVLARHE